MFTFFGLFFSHLFYMIFRLSVVKKSCVKKCGKKLTYSNGKKIIIINNKKKQDKSGQKMFTFNIKLQSTQKGEKQSETFWGKNKKIKIKRQIKKNT